MADHDKALAELRDSLRHRASPKSMEWMSALDALIAERDRLKAESDYCDVCGGNALSTRPICSACEVRPSVHGEALAERDRLRAAVLAGDSAHALCEACLAKANGADIDASCERVAERIKTQQGDMTCVDLRDAYAAGVSWASAESDRLRAELRQAKQDAVQMLALQRRNTRGNDFEALSRVEQYERDLGKE